VEVSEHLKRAVDALAAHHDTIREEIDRVAAERYREAQQREMASELAVGPTTTTTSNRAHHDGG